MTTLEEAHRAMDRARSTDDPGEKIVAYEDAARAYHAIAADALESGEVAAFERHASNMTMCAERIATLRSQCDRCGGTGQADHTCPYKRDVHADYGSVCNCCETCEDLCRDEI